MDDDKIKCVVIHRSKRHEWYLELKEGKIKDNHDSFRSFCEFLQQTLRVPEIDIDALPDTLELSKIDDENDVGNDGIQIEDKDDFGEVFEDFDSNSDNRTFYFLVKTTKTIIVKLNNLDDSKVTEVTTSVTVPDDEGDETWGVLFQDLTTKIGNAIEKPNWDFTYSLYFGNQAINKIGDLRTIFIQNMKQHVLQFNVKVLIYTRASFCFCLQLSRSQMVAFFLFFVFVFVFVLVWDVEIR